MNQGKYGKAVGPFYIDLTHRLGKGSYGEVYLGKHKETQDIVAIKMVSARNDEQKKAYEIFQKEVGIMQQLKHPNLVKFIQSYVTSNNLYVVMEYCDGGTLNEYISKKLKEQGLKYMAESEARIILRQLIGGYKEMYNKKIVHRDLKPANILIKDGLVKITDFGFGKCLGNFQSDLLQTFAGSPLYMSPQILYQNQQYTTKTDIWSLGIIFYEILFGKPPWNVTTIEQLYHCVKQKRLEFPQFPVVSPQMKEIIFKMIQYEEKDRMGWEELFQLQIFMEQQNYEKIQKSIIKITNENDILKKKNLEKNLYLNNLGQNIWQVREQQQVIERNYPNFTKHSNNSTSPNTSNSSTSPGASRRKRIFEEQSSSPSPKQMLLKNNFLNQEEQIKNKGLIQEISDWVNHKRNKSLFLNNLTSQMFDLFSDGQYVQDKNIYNVSCFVMTKYQVLILCRQFNRLQKKLIDRTSKRYTEDQWKIFCQSTSYKPAFDIIKNEYNLMKKFLQELINPAQQSISQLNQSLFDEVKSICNMNFVFKNKFDPIFDKILQFYFTSQFNQVKIEKLSINYLQFLLNLKYCTRIHIMFKFKKIDFFKYYDDLQNMEKDQLIYKILE